MNRRFWSFVLGCALGASLVLAPLTSFATSSSDEQAQITRTPPCYGHEFITNPTGNTRKFWTNNEGHKVHAEFAQFCKNCGYFTQYVYVPTTNVLLPHTPNTSKWVDYHPANDRYHHFYRVCTECYGQAGDEKKALCPGDTYGHITHP